MTEYQPTPKKKSSRILIASAAVLAVVAGGGYYMLMQSGLDQQAVEKMVKDFEIFAEAHAKQSGIEADFVYDRVEMKGGMIDRHAVIVNPRIVTVHEGPDIGTLSESVQTDQIILRPNGLSTDSVRIVFDKPISTMTEDVVGARIVSNEPFEVSLKQFEKDKAQHITVDADLPTQTKIEYLTDGKVADYVEFNASSGSRLHMTQQVDDPSVSDGKAVINGMSITSVAGDESEELIKIGKVYYDYVSSKKDASTYLMTLKGGLDKLVSDSEELPLGDVSVTYDLDYEGPSFNDPEQIEQSLAAPMKMKLNDLSVKLLGSTVNYQGDMSMSGEQMMPVGKAQMKVDKLAPIRDWMVKHEMITEADKPMLDAIFKKVTGQGWEEAESVDVNIVSDETGNFKVGNATFEELMMAVMMSGTSEHEMHEHSTQDAEEMAPENPITVEPIEPEVEPVTPEESPAKAE